LPLFGLLGVTGHACLVPEGPGVVAGTDRPDILDRQKGQAVEGRGDTDFGWRVTIDADRPIDDRSVGCGAKVARVHGLDKRLDRATGAKGGRGRC